MIVIRKKATAYLFSWIIALSLLAFVIFNAVNYYLLSTAYYERIARENQIHTENVAFGVSAFFDMTYKVVGEMAQANDVKNMDAQKQKEFIEERFSQYGFFDNIVVQRISGVGQSIKGTETTAFDDKTWWFQKIVQEKRPFISPSFYTVGFNPNKPTTVNGMFFPVMQGETVVAVLATFLRVDEVQERVGRYYRGDDRYTYILDEEGKVIVHPDGEKIKEHFNYLTAKKAIVARDSTGSPIVKGQEYQLEYQDIDVPVALRQAAKEALNGLAGETEYTDVAGQSMLCTFAPVRMPGYSASWGVITVQNKDKAMAPLWEAALANGILSFLIFAGLAGLLLRQSHVVDHWMRKLAESNVALEEEVFERTRAETELSIANEDLVATNEELTAMTEQLQTTNDQVMHEIEVRQVVEEKLRLRERQYRATVGLVTDNIAELDGQMQMMLDSALQLVGASHGYIALIENGTLFIRYVQGIYASLLGQQLAETEGLFPIVLETGQLSYIKDFQAFATRRRGGDWEKQKTAVMIPLKNDQKVVGCFALTWMETVHPMEKDELDLLQQYADLASLAFQGACFREKLRQELAQKELLHNKISQIAFYDTLTGLANRASLMMKLEEELSVQKKMVTTGAVLFIDLDDLKGINDNFGHSTGDQVIVAAGKKIIEAVGDTVFVARLGGDEFIVLLQEYNDISIMRIADKLLSYMCRDYPVGTTMVHLSASIGIALYPRDGDTVEEVIKKADNAMYAAKAAGRNCWRFFDPLMLREAQEKLLLTNSLRKSLERQELFVVYQPQVNSINGRVVGFEALLRWHSAAHGTVSPTKFIPLAEENRLIGAIGEWVLGQACEFIKKLTRSGYPSIQVAVNLSPKQLADENLIEMIARMISAAGIEPQQLELEITESAFLTSLDDSVDKLQSLEKLGVKLSLDDFGTGYSSLTHLRLFPVGKLKIDKSFIDAIPERETVLVQSLITFAREMNMVVVAEGVERQEQFDYLVSCHCDVIQGYLMSRPLPEDQALQFLYEQNGHGEEG